MLWLAAVFGSLALFGLFLDFNPRIAFRIFTPYPLPKGMTVLRGGSMLADNSFHVSSFWELQHTSSALDEFVRQGQFAPDLEDAIEMSDAVSKAMRKPVSRSQVIEGYSREQNGRDDRLLVMTNRTVSYLITN